MTNIGVFWFVMLFSLVMVVVVVVATTHICWNVT